MREMSTRKDIVGAWKKVDESCTNSEELLMLAEEEKKIRQDPAARVTNLLKKVFGSE